MSVLKPLRIRELRWLWIGQVFSCSGDEIYLVALTWLAAGMLETSAGLVTTIQSCAILFASFFGARFIDRWDHLKLMYRVDIVRGFLVLIPPLWALFLPLNLWILFPVAFLVSGFDAFFRPALVASVPAYVKPPVQLSQANALIASTDRLARILGPSLVAFLGQYMGIIYFFVIDALGFFISAFAVDRVTPKVTLKLTLKKQKGPLPVEAAPLVPVKPANLRDGWRLMGKNKLVRYFMMTGGPVAAPWILSFPLGTSLLVKLELNLDLAAYGIMVASYGVGNFTSSLAMSFFRIENPERFLNLSRIISGFGFSLLALLPTFEGKMVGAVIAAIGGPISDISFITLLQRNYSSREVALLYRLNMVNYFAWLLPMSLLSATLFGYFKVSHVMAFAGAIIFSFGVFGFIYRPQKD